MDLGEAAVKLKINITVCTYGRHDVRAAVIIVTNTGLLCVIMSSLYVEKLTRLKTKFSLRVISLFHQKMKVEN
jgi:hypothetical protein